MEESDWKRSDRNRNMEESDWKEMAGRGTWKNVTGMTGPEDVREKLNWK